MLTRKTAGQPVVITLVPTSGAMLGTENAVVRRAVGSGAAGSRSVRKDSGSAAGSGAVLPETEVRGVRGGIA
jgi:hypothetical protein